MERTPITFALAGELVTSAEQARLIAAAPDLLAAAVEFMRGEGNSKQVRDMFRAAIAKATDH